MIFSFFVLRFAMDKFYHTVDKHALDNLKLRRQMLLNLALSQPLNSQIIIGFIFVSITWLAILTILFIKMSGHYYRLTKNITKRDLKSVLDEILKLIKKHDSLNKDVLKKIEKLEEEGRFHLQKIGFLRFNPFADTGGDQSFILSILDKDDSGVVLSSLHSRGTTRLYAKKVVLGRGEPFELSSEEKRLVKKAKKIRRKNE